MTERRSNKTVQAMVFALCLAVVVLPLAVDVPASSAPACFALKLAPTSSFAAATLRKVQDWFRGIAGRETRSKQATRLRAEKAARFAEEAALRAATAAEDRSRKIASLKAEMTVVLCMLVLSCIANAGHFLHANASMLAFTVKALYANPGPTFTLIIFFAKMWWASSSTRQALVSSPLVTFIFNASQFFYAVVFALGMAYSEACSDEQEEAPTSETSAAMPEAAAMAASAMEDAPAAVTSSANHAHPSPPPVAALPVAEEFRSPAAKPSWHFTSSPEWHYTCSPVPSRAPAATTPEAGAKPELTEEEELRSFRQDILAFLAPTPLGTPVNPQPSAINLNPQPSTLNPQPSTSALNF